MIPERHLPLSLILGLLSTLTPLQSVHGIQNEGGAHGNIPFHGNGLVAACGSTNAVTARTVYIIVSPGYPAPYHPYTHCRWNFYSLGSHGGQLQVQCPLFEMESSSPCSSGAFVAIQTLDNEEGER
ncbi:hypothetical protein GWK47_054025 [Chionoecetes opilio]|uniref:CUB domain-containing protein n=1 Tax=Chionoecetes opilio TaxID=41210 RepID=A0A8J5CRY1_CHIOP|nr:hypothetical protein GWK47_054025 [Chionoecetes opilio]